MQLLIVEKRNIGSKLIVICCTCFFPYSTKFSTVYSFWFVLYNTYALRNVTVKHIISSNFWSTPKSAIVVDLIVHQTRNIPAILHLFQTFSM